MGAAILNTGHGDLPLYRFNLSSEQGRLDFLWRLSEIGHEGLLAATSHIWNSLASHKGYRAAAMALEAKADGSGKLGLHNFLARFLEDFEIETDPQPLPEASAFSSEDEWHEAVARHFEAGDRSMKQVIERYEAIMNASPAVPHSSKGGKLVKGPWTSPTPISLQSLNEDWPIETADLRKPSLTGSSVVDNVLRQFRQFVTLAVDDAVEGKISNELLADRLRTEARRLQSCFYSKTYEFDGNHWNTPQRLGVYLVKTVNLGGDPSDAVERLLRAYCHELVTDALAIRETYKNEEMREVIAEELVERYRHFLLGWHLPHDYWGDERDMFPTDLRAMRRKTRWPKVKCRRGGSQHPP